MTILMAQGWVFAEQALDSTQITQLFETLCQASAGGWIQQGQIEAIHRSSNEMTGEMMESTETIVTDGVRFSWQITVNSYKKKGEQDSQNSKDFMQWNQDRQFVWDGQTYTMYFKAGQQAIVYDNPSAVPVQATGPLTAGYIPWGRGAFAIKALLASQVSATQVLSESGNLINMTIQTPDRPQLQLVLDPARDYAVLSYTIEKKNVRIIYTYSNYVIKAGRNIPMDILIEKYQGEKLQSFDSWEILFVTDQASEQEKFAVPFQDKTLVEYRTSLLDNSLFYQHSKNKDIKPLLETRMEAAIKEDVQKQNCGTLAIKQVLEPFGISVEDTELSSLISEASGETSLYQIQQFIQKKGLYGTSAKITVEMLEQLKDCRVLLHFPQKTHFVVLDRIEGEKVWIVDMGRETFYHCMDMPEFKQEWAGIALIVSKQPILLKRGYKSIPEDVLRNIKGSGYFACTRVIQNYRFEVCPDMMLMLCMGRYEVWYPRYGCEINPSIGTCESRPLVGMVYSYCIEDMNNPGDCNITGDFLARYMRACEP
jgi:predicted double-glycine peptidase